MYFCPPKTLLRLIETDQTGKTSLQRSKIEHDNRKHKDLTRFQIKERHFNRGEGTILASTYKNTKQFFPSERFLAFRQS